MVVRMRHRISKHTRVARNDTGRSIICACLPHSPGELAVADNDRVPETSEERRKGSVLAWEMCNQKNSVVKTVPYQSDGILALLAYNVPG